MKKNILRLISIILIAFFAFQASALIEQTTDENDITHKCSFTVSENKISLSNLKDGSIYSYWQGGKGATLTIKCSDAIGAIYILWDRASVSFTIQAPSGSNVSKKGGQDGFLNEFIPLKEPVNTLTLTFDEEAGSIDDIYVFGTGDIPDWVQQWQPMLEKADMLVLVAHADDEFLWMGGTLPVYAGEYHKKVQVAYLVHHGKVRNEYFRNHELLDGLWQAGVTNYPMISDFEDYYTHDMNEEIKFLGEDAVLRFSVTLLRRFKPDVVVTHDINGEYGHGAHKLCAYAIQKSISMSGDPTVYPDIAEKYGVWNIKKCYLHLYPENTVTMDWDKPLDAFGGKTGIDVAKQCYLKYESQLGSAYRVKGKGSKNDCRKFGLYYSAVGPDINKNDFFENIESVIPMPTNTQVK